MQKLTPHEFKKPKYEQMVIAQYFQDMLMVVSRVIQPGTEQDLEGFAQRMGELVGMLSWQSKEIQTLTQSVERLEQTLVRKDEQIARLKEKVSRRRDG